MNLELKHLSPYLPYSLKIEHPTMLVGKRKISELKNLGQTNIEISHRLYVQISNCKPILRPLSDLTKEIEVMGKKFVPIEVLNNMLFTKHSKLEYYDSELCNGALLFSTNIKGYNILSMNEKVQKILEWHFDIFGLIEKGLAISIHDVEQADA